MPKDKPRVTSLPNRQATLLALVNALGGTVGNLDFQKLLFLYCGGEAGPAYHFVPYKYGAFSFASYADRRKLIERGLLEDDTQAWRLSPAGLEATKSLGIDPGPLVAFANRYRNLHGDALVAETYRSHPYYATRSEIAGRVLKGDQKALQRIADQRSQTGNHPLTTIGYEGRSLDQYLNILLRAGTTLLCDVRRNPISRKYGFSKTTLAHACVGVGIRYEHLPQLGIASELRRGIEDETARRTLFENYRRETIPREQPALAQIHAWVAEGERVTLTCFEHLPSMCHRHCVADALVEHFGDLFAPHHL